MAWFDVFKRGGETRSIPVTTTLANAAQWFVDFVTGGATSESEVVINERTVLSISTVWACVRAISEDVAGCPLMVVRRKGPIEFEPVSHPTEMLLNRRPNPEMPAFTMRETLVANCVLWGNSYAEIVRDSANRPIELALIQPDRVTPRRSSDGRIVYDVQRNNGDGVTVVPAANMIHVRGLGFNGLYGYSVVKMGTRSFGIAANAESWAQRIFKTSGRPGGILKHPNKLSPEAKKNLADSWRAMYSGQNAGATAVLDEGMMFEAMGIPPDDVELLASRQYSVPDICRWFRMPPHKVADLTKSSFSNIESQGIDYVTGCLRGWMSRVEGELTVKLLDPKSEPDLEYLHDESELTRGDMPSRMDAYGKGRQWGIYTINEIRRREGLSPVSPEVGDRLMVPANMLDAEKHKDWKPAGDSKPSEPTGGNQPGKSNRNAQAVRSLSPAFAQAVRSTLRIERDRGVRAAEKGELAKWSADFYPSHLEDVRHKFKPIIEAAQGVMVAGGIPASRFATDDLLNTIAADHIAQSKRELSVESGRGWNDVIAGWDTVRPIAQAQRMVVLCCQAAGIPTEEIEHADRNRPTD